MVVQRIEWEIPNFQIGVRFPSEVQIKSLFSLREAIFLLTITRLVNFFMDSYLSIKLPRPSEPLTGTHKFEKTNKGEHEEQMLEIDKANRGKGWHL